MQQLLAPARRIDHRRGEFAGTKITGRFGGSGYETTDLSALFTKTGSLSAAATIQGGVAPVPEPGTMGLLGASLLFLGYRARKRLS